MQEHGEYRGRLLLDRAGQKVGTVEEVYVDRETGKPEWLLMKTGLFGLRGTFVPISSLRRDGEHLRAGYTKDHINSAPDVGDEEGASPEEEVRLFQHYGIPHDDAGTVSGPSAAESPATTSSAQEPTETTVQRSEEQLRVGKVRRPSELVRLRKRVETEPVSTTVELEHEEVHIVREPVNERRGARRPRIGEGGEIELRLEREEPVVEKEVVPRETVRLEKEIRTEEQTVEGQVRKERVEVERDPDRA